MGVVAEASDNRQPLAKNQAGVAVLILILVIAVGVGLYFILHKDAKKHPTSPGNYKPVTARVLNAAQLQAERPHIGGQLFYWAGTQRGYSYEFRRTVKGFIYVRYLPSGLHAGATGNFRVVATYPFTEAVNGLQGQAYKVGADVKRGRGGSYYFVDPKRPRTVYMAWDNVDAQVELFGTSPVDAVSLAKSGKIRTAHP